MKKERMITRTITSTVCTCLAVDITTAEVKDELVILSGEYKSDSERTAAAVAQSTDTLKIVSIKHYDVLETLYGMPESLFMKYATPLPPRKNYSEEA